MVLVFEPVRVMKSFKLVEHLAEAACVAAHPNGKIYATGGLDDRVLIWDYSTGSRKKVIRGFGGMVLSLSFHEDGSLFVGGNGSILRVDVETGETLSKIAGFKGFVYSLSVFSNFLVSGGQDGRVRCWGLDGEAIWEKQIDIGSVHGLEKLPDSSLLVVGERPSFHVLDIRGNLISEIPAHRDSISSLAVHSGGFLIATGSDDGSVSIWKNGDWTLLKNFDCEAPVTSLSFSPKHSLLAVGRKYENAILLDWNKRKKYLSNISKSEGVTSFEWSLDGAALFGTLSNGTVLGWGKKPKSNKVAKKPKKEKREKVESLVEKKDEGRGDVSFISQIKEKKFLKNRYFQIFAIAVIFLISSLLLKDPSIPPKSKIREARSYIEEENWVRASSLLNDLSQEWPESADVSNLLASYEQDAFVSLKIKIQSLFDSGNFKESISELKKIPLKPDLAWVSSLLKKSYEMRLSEIKESTKIDMYINPYLDYDDDFLKELSLLLSGLRIEKPDWLLEAEVMFELSQKIPFGSLFKDNLDYFLKNSTAEEIRYFSEKAFPLLLLEKEDEALIFAQLYELSKIDNLPVYVFNLPEQVYSLSQSEDFKNIELLLGVRGGYRILSSSPFRFSNLENGDGDIDDSLVQKVHFESEVFWASSKGAWVGSQAGSENRKIISSKRYFDAFDLADNGFGVFHESETRSLQVVMGHGSSKFVWDGLESRQIKLSVNNNEHIAIGYNFGPNNSIVSLYSVMKGELMGLSAVGNLTINQPVIDVLLNDSGTIFAFDQNGQVWIGNASQDFPKAKKMLKDPKSIKLGSVVVNDSGSFAFATEFTDEVFVFDSDGNQLSGINWDPSLGKIWTLGFLNYLDIEMLVVVSEENLVFLNMEERNE